jgi:hypothetical protein
MAAAPDDDARPTLAALEAKLLELERELLQDRQPEAEPPPAAAPPAVDRDALREARAQIAELRATLAVLAATAERLRAEIGPVAPAPNAD